ncbi:MAG: SDR family NAD(P)-dependent oxidoreductase [Firmicutes bacterium]|nr:SDR family NAD(P)-dependent oxidoreductase [Bacillota bacterium]
MSIAIITGASSGLGREFVKQLDEKKIFNKIWVIARREEMLKRLADECETPLKILPWDLTDKSFIPKLKELLKNENPHIRLLVNAAGFGKIGSYKDISLVDCDNMIELNCRAAVEMTQLVLPYMKRGSRIIEVCSTSAFQPFQYLNVYSATKAFLYHYTRALNVELKDTGIVATALCPYWVKDTEFIGTAKKTMDSDYINNFHMASKRKNVVAQALQDSANGLAVSTPGMVCKAHRALSGFLPASLLMGGWEMLRGGKK